MTITATLSLVTGFPSNFDIKQVDLFQRAYENVDDFTMTPARAFDGAPDGDVIAAINRGVGTGDVEGFFKGNFPAGLTAAELGNTATVNAWLDAAKNTKLTSATIYDYEDNYRLEIDFGDDGPTLKDFIENWDEPTLRSVIEIFNGDDNPDFVPPMIGLDWSGNNKDNTKSGTEQDDVMSGKGGDDTLTGKKGDDLIKGGTGQDKMFGGNGKDDLFGGDGKDNIDGGKGNDGLFGGAGNDAMKGGSGKDKLKGGSGNDMLKGGNGNDELVLSKGKDKAYGGGGADTFVFNKGETGGKDTLWVDENDSITLSGFKKGTDVSVTKIGKDTFEMEVGNGLAVAKINFDDGRAALIDLIDFI